MPISQQVLDAIASYISDEEVAIKIDLRHDDAHTSQFTDEETGVTYDVIFYMSEQNDYIEYDFA